MSKEKINQLAEATRSSGNTINKVYPPRIPDPISPVWKNWRPFSNLETVNNALSETRDGLNTVKRGLEGAKKVLDQMRNIVKIISVFESLIKNTLYTFMNILLDKVQESLNDAKSTGVYSLDLFSYHWRDRSEEEELEDESYNKAIRESWAGPAVKSGAKDSDNPVPESGFFSAESWSAIADLLSNVGVSYKKESYNEFMDNICEAFLDEDDVADSSLVYAGHTGIMPTSDKSKGYPVTYVEEAFNREKENTDRLTVWPGASTQLPKLLQSGRPEFGMNGTMNVILVTFAFPRIEDFLSLSVLINKFLLFDVMRIDKVKGLFENSVIDTDVEVDEYGNEITDSEDSKIPSKIRQGWNDITDNLEFPSLPMNNLPHGVRGKEPNFVGVTAYQLVAPLFDLLQNAVDFMRTLFATPLEDHNLAGLINGILDSLEEEINKLIRLIAMIDHFISMLEAILSITGLRVLMFSTDNGNAGVVEALKNAKGFNSDYNEEDIKKLHEQIAAKKIQIEDAQIASRDTEYEDLNELAVLQIELDELYIKLNEAEPNGAHERRRRNIAQKRIDEMKTEYEEAEANLVDSNKILTQLDILYNAVDLNWKPFVDAEGLEDLRTELAALQGDKDIEVATYDITIGNLTSDVSDASFESLITVENDSWTTENAVYESNISGWETEITDYTADQNNPETPNVIDFDDVIEDLEDSITAEELLQTEALEIHDDTIEMLTDGLEVIDGMLITEELKQTFIEALEVSQNDANPEFTGSPAEGFKNIDEGYDADIIVNEDAIVAIDLEYEEIIIAMGELRSVFAGYGINPDDYNEYTGGNNTYDDLFNGSNTSGTYYERGWFWCVDRIDAIPTERELLELNITNLKISKEENDDQLNIFMYANNLLQEQSSITIAYINAVLALDVELEAKELYIVDQDVLITNKQNTITSLLDTAYENYMHIIDEDFTDTIAWIDTQLSSDAPFDLYEPILVEGFKDTYIDINTKQSQDVDILKGIYENEESNENKKIDKYNKTDRLESTWTPTQRMYYGGFLCCVGWPNYTAEDENGEPSYFNISKITSDFFSTDDGFVKESSDDTIEDLKKQWNNLKGIFGGGE